MKFHLLYHDKNGKFHNIIKEFGCFAEAEIWLQIIEAKNWEIGIPDEYFKTILNDTDKLLR
jgi:hypothetical protein